MRLLFLFFVLLLAAHPGSAQSATTRDTVPPDDSLVLRREVQDAQTKTALPYLSLVLKTEKDSAFVAGANWC